VKVRVKRKPLKASLCRPLLITLLLIGSFCVAPVARADTVILTNPSNLVAITISNSQINLTWTDNASNEIGYTVERRIGSGSYAVIANLMANTTTYIDSGLTSGITYTYRVLAMGNGSNISSSGYSSEASASTSGGTSSGVLATPSSLVANAASASQVNLTWADNASGETGYIVERAVGSGSFTILGYLSANSQSFPDTGLATNTTYSYRVQAVGNGTTTSNSAYSNTAVVTLGSSSSSQQGAPSGLTATAVSNTQINLTWVDNSISEAGYILERSVNGGAFEIAAYLSANSQSFSDTALTAYTVYKYRVYARGDGINTSNSGYSNEAYATTGSYTTGAMAAPTGLTASAVTGSQVNLIWTDNASSETGYNVERATGNSGSFVLLAYLGANAQSFSDTSLVANTTYIYRVQARGNGTSTSNSAYSNEATVTLGQTSSILTPPSYIVATAVSESQINLVWTDNTTGESGYNVERKTADGSYSSIAYLAADVQSYSDLGLQAGTTYTYRILARGNGTTIADSTYSAEASATTTGATSKTTVLRFYIGRMYYYLNDEGQFMDAAPVIQSNRTLLPITYAALPLGVEVDWNDSEKKITLTRQGKVIELWIGKNTATVNGEKQNIDAQNAKVVPTVVGGRTMLPLAFVAQALDCAVDWDASTQEVKITYPKP